MTHIFNDRYKVNLILTVLFIFGIGTSLYLIYSLPANLRLADGYQPEFTGIYLTIGITFLLGALTLTSALKYRKEIIIYRDRIVDKADLEREAAEQAGRTTISLENVRNGVRMAKGEKDALQAGLQAICKQLDAGQGALYRVIEADGKRMTELRAGYALNIGESTVIRYEFGEGLIGQCAVSGRTLSIDDVPTGYINIISGLGNASPKYLLIVPAKQQEQVVGVMEIASFTSFSEDQRKFAEEAVQVIAEKISSKA